MNNTTRRGMREPDTQISYETGGGLAMSPLDLSQSMQGKGSSERGRTGFVQREDFDSLSSIPLPGPCYLIHNPSLNCEHRCLSHPQPAARIVYPIS